MVGATHVGSLPRPQAVVDLLFARERGQAYDQAAFDATMADVVSEAVRRRVAAGIGWVSDGKVLVPGVVDTTTNFVEHPEVVRQRVERFTGIVGPDRVVAGPDCGFGTFAGFGAVDPEIAWAKLATLAEGARRAS